ncbi:MAG: hypothetical protein IJY15_10075, partial [Thermoguttaceae bacterium]|nr:hypothetical protein [Thermoguttaceae bacterium]
DLPAPPVSVETIGTTTLDFAVGAVPNATSYVYRFAASEAELENATPVALDAAGIVALSGLNANATYYFQAQAIGDGESYLDSAWSTPVSATTLKIGLPAPSVSATPVDASTRTFGVGSVANADEYLYEYSTSPDFANSTTLTSTELAYDAPHLSPSATYYFRAKAIGSGAYETSDWSETVSATTPKFNLAAPPIETVATSSSEIELTIGSVERATGYYYEYSADPNFGNVLSGMTSAGTVKISALEPHTKYYFRVLAYGGPTANISAWSTDDATTLQAKLPAPQPTLALGGTGALTLSFDAVPNATSYVYRYSTSPDFANATTATATATSAGSCTVRNLAPGKTYYFQTTEVGDGERYLDSDWSSAISATTSAIDLPAPPVAVQTVGSTTLTFKIDAVAGADAYEYCYATSEEGLETAEVKRVSSSGTVELSGLDPVTKYYIQARAVGNETNYENSGWSRVAATTVKIALDAPQVGATAVDASTITFEIQEVANADYYEYEYSTSRYFTAETTT